VEFPSLGEDRIFILLHRARSNPECLRCLEKSRPLGKLGPHTILDGLADLWSPDRLATYELMFAPP
jgi:hypothetical protein